MAKQLKKLYISKNRQKLIDLPIWNIYHTTLRYRDDKDRRDLAELTKHGYFKRLSRFVFKRIPTKI